MSKSFILSKPFPTDTNPLLWLYDMVAEHEGINKDNVIYDCTKIDISTKMQDDMIEAFKAYNPQIDTISIMMYLLNVGPKASKELKVNEIIYSKHFFSPKESEPEVIYYGDDMIRDHVNN